MRTVAIVMTLLALGGCGSNAPQPAASNRSLGGAVEAMASPSDPMAATSGAPMPQATGGGAAVQ